jgi:hypothetical protein
MSAGLPATALGGALYLLLVVWMVVRELTRTKTNTGSEPSRWPFIGKMVFVWIAMLVVVLGERLLVQSAFELALLYMPGLAKFAMAPSSSLVLFMVAMPFVIIVLIGGCLQLLRFKLNTSKRGVVLLNNPIPSRRVSRAEAELVRPPAASCATKGAV